MALSPRLLKRARKIPKFSSLGYTRLWGLTNKVGAVSGTASSDTGKFAVKWWDQSVDIFNNGDTFTKSGSGTRAFDIYPVELIVTDSSEQSHNVIKNGSVQLSTAQSKFGGKSAFFNSGYLTISSASAFGMGTGDFTIEMFVYPTEITAVGGLINLGTYDNGLLWRQGNNVDQIYVTADGGTVTGNQNWDATTNAPLNTWTHIAMVRSSGTIKVYANGVAVLTFASSENLGVSKDVMIGACAHNTGEVFYGYIDDLRIVKGVAIYTSNFTPPSSSLTAVSGTVLLLRYDDENNVPLGQFDGFSVAGNELTQLRAENVSLTSAPGYYTSSYYNYVPGATEEGNLSSNLLNAAALDQFYTDLLNGIGNLYVTGNPGIVSDTPTIATGKGYTVFGSVPP